MKCSKCGNELKENDEFCNKCGKKVKKSKSLSIGVIIVLVVILLFIIANVMNKSITNDIKQQAINDYKYNRSL